MTLNQKLPKIKNDPKSKMTQNQKWPKIENDPNLKNYSKSKKLNFKMNQIHLVN